MRFRLYSIFVFGTRIFLGLIMFSSGMSKLFHGAFPGLIGPVWLTDELAKYGLEYLGLFIAWSQTLIGLLLMTQRFALLGAIMLLPMLLNIFFVMLSLGLHHYDPNQVNSAINTSVINSFFLLLNFILLFHDYHKWKFLFDEDETFLKTGKVKRKNIRADYMVLAGILVSLSGPLFYPQSKSVAYILVFAGILICIIPAFMRKNLAAVS